MELDGPEVPILDGSALPWLDAFETAGLVALERALVPFVPSRVLIVSDLSAGKPRGIRPARELRVTYTIDFPNPAVGRQSITVVLTPGSYAAHLAPARTFGFLSEYEALKAHGLARGAREDNCIVVGDDRVENGDLCFADEFKRQGPRPSSETSRLSDAPWSATSSRTRPDMRCTRRSRACCARRAAPNSRLPHWRTPRL